MKFDKPCYSKNCNKEPTTEDRGHYQLWGPKKMSREGWPWVKKWKVIKAEKYPVLCEFIEHWGHSIYSCSQLQTWPPFWAICQESSQWPYPFLLWYQCIRPDNDGLAFHSPKGIWSFDLVSQQIASLDVLKCHWVYSIHQASRHMSIFQTYKNFQ